MNYSHILSIQIWSERINQTTNYGNILNRVRELIIDSIHTYEIDYNGKNQLYSLLWKKAKWDTMVSKLYIDDIVTTAYGLDDDIIYQHTCKMLKEIEEKLCINKKMDGDYNIIFSIVKPIVPKKAYFEAVEFVDL
jgi:hypothetical protein